MSRARYHKMGEAPQLSGHQEQPVGNDRSKRKPKAETQVLGAAFPDAGRERAQREAEAIAEQTQGLGALRERLGLSDVQDAGSEDSEPSYKEEFLLQKRQLVNLEAYIQDNFGHTARELDADPNIINKGKGLAARAKGWLYGKVGKSTNGLLDVQLSQWRTLKKEVARKEEEMEPPTGYGDPRTMARVRGKIAVINGRGGMSLAEEAAHTAQKREERQAAAAYRRDNYDDTNARETLEKGKIAYAAGNTKRANALASALTEQAFFDDGLTLEGAVPKIKRDTARAEAIAKARTERVKKDGASEEDYEALPDERFNALLAENMASQKELEDGALPPPYATNLRRGRGNQYTGGSMTNIESAFTRIGANQLLGRPVVEAPRSTVEAAFANVLIGSETLLQQARNFQAKGVRATEAQMNAFQAKMKGLAEERSRLADTPGFDQTPQYAQAMKLYRDLVEVNTELTEGVVPLVNKKEKRLPSTPAAEAPNAAEEQAKKWLLSGEEIWIKRSSGDMQRATVGRLVGDGIVKVYFTDPASGKQKERNFSAEDLVAFQQEAPRSNLPNMSEPEPLSGAELNLEEFLQHKRKMETGGSVPVAPETGLPLPNPVEPRRVPDAATLEKKRQIDRRREEAMGKADREAFARLEVALGAGEAKRLYEEINARIVINEKDMVGASDAVAAEIRQDVADRRKALAKMFGVGDAPVLHTAIVQKYMALVQKTRQLGTETLRKQLAKANELLGFVSQHNIVAPEEIPELVKPGEEEIDEIDAELIEDEAGAERFEAAVATRPSSKHESWNEDSSIANDAEQLYGVLDGVGGHAGGEFASKFSKKYIEQNAASLNQDDPAAVKEAMEVLLKTLSVELIKEAKERNIKGPGSTASLVKIIENLEGKRTAVIGTVGDSRSYVRRANGTVKFMSEDQSIGYASRKAGIMSAEEASAISAIMANLDSEKDLQKAMAKNSRLAYAYQNRNVIAQSIGSSENITPEVVTVDLDPGDEVIITSDGVHDNLTDNEIQQILAMEGTAQAVANMLVQKAYARSQDGDHLRGKPDDITAVVASGPSTRKAKPIPVPTPRKGYSAKPPAVPQARTRKAS